jgi:hypothetical protein
MQLIINICIWWGGWILYGHFFPRNQTGFWSELWAELTDPWSYLLYAVLILIQFIVGKLFFKKEAIEDSEIDGKIAEKSSNKKSPIKIEGALSQEDEEVLLKIANDINKECPTQLDEQTKLIGAIVGPVKKFTYKYNITLPGDTDINTIKSAIKAQITKAWKTDPENNPVGLYDLGIEICYLYQNDHGVELFKISKKKR